MTRRLHEVQAGMDTVVDNFLTVDLVLVFQILVESRFDVLNNWSPTGDRFRGKLGRGGTRREPLIVVYKVTETRGINNG